MAATLTRRGAIGAGLALLAVRSVSGATRPMLAPGARVVTLGDSIVQANNRVIGGVIENRADGEIAWAGFLSPRFRHQIWADPSHVAAADRAGRFGNTTVRATGDVGFSGGNLGYAGDTATGTLKRLDAALNTGAEIIVYAAGTNTGTTDAAPEAAIASIEAAVVRIVAAGRRCVVRTVLPRRVARERQAGALPPAGMARALRINAWVRANAARLGAALWDPWEELRDPVYPPGHPLYGSDAPGITRDGVHLAPEGAFRSGRALARVLEGMIAPGTWFDPDPDAGNLLPAAKRVAAVSAAGVSGRLPEGCAVAVYGGDGAVTCDCETEGDGSAAAGAIRLTLTSAGAAPRGGYADVRLFLPPVMTGFRPDDFLSAFFEIRTIRHPMLVGMQGTLGTGGTVAARGLGRISGDYLAMPYPTVVHDLSGWLVTEPLHAGARPRLDMRLDLHLRADIAGTTTVRIGRRLLETVEDPRTAFPWSP